MSNFNLADKFTDLHPIEQPPNLTAINGIGRMLVGRRDYDEETDTHVSTLCFCFLFIPLFAFAAYRVACVPDGAWTFLGRVSLSRFAKCWNVFLPSFAALALGLLGWVLYTDTADYKAGKQIADADRLVERGEAGRAARMYREVLIGTTGKAPAARKRLQGLIETPPESLEEAASVFEIAMELYWQEQEVVPDLFAQGMKVVHKNQENDPKSGAGGPGCHRAARSAPDRMAGLPSPIAGTPLRAGTWRSGRRITTCRRLRSDGRHEKMCNGAGAVPGTARLA